MDTLEGQGRGKVQSEAGSASKPSILTSEPVESLRARVYWGSKAENKLLNDLNKVLADIERVYNLGEDPYTIDLP
jgi:hypothetical protein